MDSELTRYIGSREGSMRRAFKYILEATRRGTFEQKSCLGEKKVRITISIEEID